VGGNIESIIEQDCHRGTVLVSAFAKESNMAPENVMDPLVKAKLDKSTFEKDNVFALTDESKVFVAHLLAQKQDLEKSISQLEKIAAESNNANMNAAKLAPVRKQLIETEVDIALAIIKFPNLFDKEEAMTTLKNLKAWERKEYFEFKLKLAEQRLNESEANRKHNLIKSVSTATVVIGGLGLFSAAMANSWLAFAPFGLAGALLLVFLSVMKIDNKQNSYTLLKNKKALRDLGAEIKEVQFVAGRLDKSKLID